MLANLQIRSSQHRRYTMASMPWLFAPKPQFSRLSQKAYPTWTCVACQRTQLSSRLSTTARAQDHSKTGGPFGTRLRTALRNTKVQWKPIPIGFGIGFLGVVQFYRVRKREKERQWEENALNSGDDNGGNVEEHKKRKRIKPSGPW